MLGGRLVRVAAALAAGCVLAPASLAPAARAGEIRRPLHLPRVAPGASCPVSRPDPAVDFARLGVGRGLGKGPAYPILPRAVLSLQPAEVFGGGAWLGQKVLWLVHPRSRTAVLVRGRRVDGAGRVRFGRGAVPATELVISSGVREQPSLARMRAPGCYAFQIDGPALSRVIVFRATVRA